MIRPLLMPDIGPGPHPMRVVQWLVESGNEVLSGDRLVEVASGGVLFSVHAPWNGRLVRTEAGPDVTVTVGSVLGRIETEDDGDE